MPSNIPSNRPSAWTTPMPCKLCSLAGIALLLAGIGSCALGAITPALILLALGFTAVILNTIRAFIVVRNRKRRFWR